MALEFPQDDWRTPNNREGKSAAESEFCMLMSLALDGMLDAEEEERFHRYMADDPALADEWQLWQGLNVEFDEEPSVAPPAGFVDSVIGQLTLKESSDVHALMSLALDGLLETDDEKRLNRFMEQDPTLANDWQVWQDIGNRFNDEPSMFPPEGFVEKVAIGIVAQERRQRLRLGIVVGAATTFAWMLLMLALLGGGIYAIMYESAWVGAQIRNMTEVAVIASDWIGIVSDTVNRTVEATVGANQMWGVALGYAAATGLIIFFWTRFLRRSVNPVVTS